MSKDKAQKLFNSITDINDEHIEAARGFPKRKIHWMRLAAACLAVAVTAGVIFGSLRGNKELPMLHYTEPDYGCGFEGYFAYDISDLCNGNPWTEDTKIKKLPVYQNNITYDIVQNYYGYSVDDMWQRLYELVDRFGFDKDNVVYQDDAPEQRQIELFLEVYEREGMTPLPDDYFAPRTVEAIDGRNRISVSFNNSVCIRLESDKLYSEGYDLSTYEGACELAEYLKNEYVLGKYKDVFGMKNPQISIIGSDYNIYGERGDYGITFYEKGKNIVEDIINYHFRTVGISGRYDEHEDCYITTMSYNMSDDASYLEEHTTKLGDYPIISADEAKQLLLDGYYATSMVQWDMPGEEYIAKVELIYRTSPSEQVFMPYYRFLIELPEASPLMKEEFGLKDYGAYYVPAVEGKYIDNMPTYDGRFN